MDVGTTALGGDPPHLLKADVAKGTLRPLVVAKRVQPNLLQLKGSKGVDEDGAHRFASVAAPPMCPLPDDDAEGGIFGAQVVELNGADVAARFVKDAEGTPVVARGVSSEHAAEEPERHPVRRGAIEVSNFRVAEVVVQAFPSRRVELLQRAQLDPAELQGGELAFDPDRREAHPPQCTLPMEVVQHMETDPVTAFAKPFHELQSAVSSVILGQRALVEDLLVAALARGHVLIEGAPGLGKTRLVRAFADATQLSFGRVQFTPDLMPADVTGSTVFVEEGAKHRFEFQPGPVFHHVLLADEINRATPKTQSALLEAMQEQAVTVSGVRHELPRPFMVLATQNPIEMEGTYPLPEAQLDRFLFKLTVPRPDAKTLQQVLQATTGELAEPPREVLTRAAFLEMQATLRAVPIAPSALEWVVQLIDATHEHPMVRLGASPRGAQALVLAAKGYALAAGRPHVEMDDLQRAALPALRHRLLLSFEAEVEGVDPDGVVLEAVAQVEGAKRR